MTQQMIKMTNNDIGLEAEINDVALTPLGFSAQTICQGVDGSLFLTRRGVLYHKGPDEKEFSQICQIDDANQANILGFDNAGNLYYAGKFTGELKRSTDYGKTFTTCLKDGGTDCFRGFTVDNQGALYIGSYGKFGPASLYCSSDDGKSWTAIQTFRCRHIHDVEVNPKNNWLYVVTGELKDSQEMDAYGIFRSKDGGQSWIRLVTPEIYLPGGLGRPLYLSIGFIGDKVVLSTDHPEGGNGIDVFMDTGEDRFHQPKRVLSYHEPTVMPEGSPPYCWGFRNFGEYIYTICTGKSDSLLYRSRDGIHWQECAQLPPWTAQKPEVKAWGDRMYIAGHKDSYALVPKNIQYNGDGHGNIHAFWLKKLMEHDQRYADETSPVHCRGYFARSLKDTLKQQTVLDILQEYAVSKDGLIADVGCGIGPVLLAGRHAGYTGFVGIEAKPRWLIAARHLYESTFPGESPALRLAPYGTIAIPNFPKCFAAVLLIGVFAGNGNNVKPEQALATARQALADGGLLCFNVSPTLLGEKTVDIFLSRVAELGFKNMRCRQLRDTFYISAIKA